MHQSCDLFLQCCSYFSGGVKYNRQSNILSNPSTLSLLNRVGWDIHVSAFMSKSVSDIIATDCHC